MKRVIISSVVAVLATMSFVSCAAKAPSAEAKTGQIEKKNLSQEKIKVLITEAAEVNGWMITEFKHNAVIAEKIGDKSSVAVTVTFENSYFDITPANSELEDIINDALNKIK